MVLGMSNPRSIPDAVLEKMLADGTPTLAKLLEASPAMAELFEQYPEPAQRLQLMRELQEELHRRYAAREAARRVGGSVQEGDYTISYDQL